MSFKWVSDESRPEEVKGEPEFVKAKGDLMRPKRIRGVAAGLKGGRGGT